MLRKIIDYMLTLYFIISKDHPKDFVVYVLYPKTLYINVYIWLRPLDVNGYIFKIKLNAYVILTLHFIIITITEPFEIMLGL